MWVGLRQRLPVEDEVMKNGANYVRLSNRPSVNPSVCHSFVYQSVHLSIVHLSIRLSVCLSSVFQFFRLLLDRLSIHPSIVFLLNRPSLSRPSVNRPSVNPSVRLSIVHLSIRPSVNLPFVNPLSPFYRTSSSTGIVTMKFENCSQMI